MQPEQCRACVTAAWMLRRIGFRDNIGWGPLGGPTQTYHASHSNSGEMLTKAADFYIDAKGRQVITGVALTMPGPAQPLCLTYRSELAWLMAGRPARVTVYMAHPVSGDFEFNIKNAGAWLNWLRSRTETQLAEITGVVYNQRPLILAPWLGGALPDDQTPGGRSSVMADCRDAVTLFDEVWCVGGMLSSGMLDEGSVAKVCRDLTHLGVSPPIAEPPILKMLPPLLIPKSDRKPRKR